MRPVALSLSGLHSYRERAEIDFTELGRYGLFGIFGRMGSGKSTLLDAITLALYGVVDRLGANARKGPWGPGECEVRFRFALDGPEGPGQSSELYEVYRCLRSSDGRARRATARLLQWSDPAGMGSPRVLADREAEVNRVVEEVIGLGPEDFVRAVVLPQGKFVELLHLQGQERRQMLQRIFRLQVYGEDLRQKVRSRLEAGRRRQVALDRELARLGDASPEAVRLAETQCLAARASRSLEEAAQRELLLAVQSAAQQRERHARRAELMAQLHGGAAQHRVPISEQALAWRPIVALAREWRALKEVFARDHARAQEAQEAEREVLAALRSLEDQALAAQQAHARAQARRDELEAERRRLKREHSKVRVSLEERDATQRAVAAAERVHAVRRRLEQAQGEEESAREGLQKAQKLCEAAESDRAEAHAALQRALAAVEVLQEIADREPLEADRLRTEPPEDEQQLLLARQRAEDRAVERRALEEAHRQAIIARQQAEAALETATAERKRATEVLRGAERALREAETALEGARARVAAASLAAKLVPAHPCPVCGSPHHPAPAGGAGSAGGAEGNLIDLPAAAVEAHRMGRERAMARYEEALSVYARAEAALEEARLTESRQERLLAECEDPSLELAELSERLQRAREARQQEDEIGQRRARAHEEVRRCRLEVERKTAPVAAARARVEAAELELDRARQRREQLAAEAEAAWVSFDRERGSLALLEIPSAASALAARDRRAEALQEALERLEAELSAAEGEAESAARALQEASAASQQPALQELRQQRAREAVLAHAEAERSRAALASVQDRLMAEASRAGLSWAGDFAHDSEGLETWLAEQPPDEALSSWEERRKELLAQLEALGGEDQEPALDEAAFSALQAALDAQTAKLEEAREQAALTARLHAELLARTARWQELTEEAKRLEVELARLEELSTLLRGDRFAEFIAHDHLSELTQRATTYLRELSAGRYGLALDGDRAFLVVDEVMGRARPVYTLSGGESFLTALALALALSAKVQERSSRPLGFFFLDEGFGSLDAEALDRVMTAIEGLRDGQRLIGLISHLPAVRERVPRYLWVEPSVSGSRVRLLDN